MSRDRNIPPDRFLVESVDHKYYSTLQISCSAVILAVPHTVILTMPELDAFSLLTSDCGPT